MPTPDSLLNRAEGRDLQSLLQQGIGGILLAIATGIISGILSITDVVVQPLDAAATAFADLAIAIFGSPARIVLAGAEQTASSLTGGFAVGPLTFGLAVASVLAGLWVVSTFRDDGGTGNFLPGLPFDVPVIGEDEEGE